MCRPDPNLPFTALLLAFLFLTNPVYPAEAYSLRALSLREREAATGNPGMHTSGIKLGPREVVGADGMVPLVTFSLNSSTEVPKRNAAAIELMSQALRTGTGQVDDARAMFGQMKAALETNGHSVEHESFGQIVDDFINFAHQKLVEVFLPLADKYNLDPATPVVLEWGSDRSAYFRTRGKYGQEIILNINLFNSDLILQGETLHEILHPCVSDWLAYAHIEMPEIFEAAGIVVKKGEVRPVERGYYANAWEWDLGKDDTGLFMEGISALQASSDEVMRQQAILLQDCLSGKSKDNAVARLRDILELMCSSNEAKTRQVGEYLRDVFDAKALMEAVGELFILNRELKFFDSNRDKAIAVFRDKNNPLDHTERFAGLLTLRGDARLEAVIRYIADSGVYSPTAPQLVRGADILSMVWDRDRGIVLSALKKLDEALDASTPVAGIASPRNIEQALSIISRNDVQWIHVRFRDPEGRLAGQTKTVMVPVNEATLGIFENGISFDGSSITASVDGRPLGEVYASDFAARIVPGTLKIRKTPSGEKAALIDADVMFPSENKPQDINPKTRAGLEKDFRTRQKIKIDRESVGGATEQNKRTAAIIQAMYALRERGLKEVKLLVNCWADEPVEVIVPVDELGRAFDIGVELSEDQTEYLPTNLRNKTGFSVMPDPFSLSLIEYAPAGANEAEIEAVMAVEIQRDGSVFEGDFRNRLIETVQKAEQEGYTPLVAPEPEVFFLRRIEGANRVTADGDRYYDDLSVIPADLQAVLKDIMTAAGAAGITIRYAHHEVAKGQFELPYEHGPALTIADKTTFYKYIVRRIAARHGLEACFMPKPVNGENGSGMHLHLSLFANRDMRDPYGVEYKKGDNVFYDPAGKFHLSITARHCIGGLLRFAPVILRVTNPDPNSYRRLVPHYEAPNNLAWSQKNRSSAVRVPYFPEPFDGDNAKGARFEYRVVDAGGNIYAKFYVVLEAMLEGINQGIDAPEPVAEANIFQMGDEELQRRGIVKLPGGPGGLEKAVNCMNDANSAATQSFVDNLFGARGSDLREFLSVPGGVFNPPNAPVARLNGIIPARETAAAI